MLADLVVIVASCAEEAFSALKASIRGQFGDSLDGADDCESDEMIERAFADLTLEKCRSFIRHAGYAS
jgi:hypothetical protein